MVTLEISILPLGTSEPGISKFIASSLQVLKEKGISFELTPTSTIIQGNLSEILKVAQEMHEAPFKEGIQRVITTLKIDDRRDKAQTLEERRQAVLAILK